VRTIGIGIGRNQIKGALVDENGEIFDEIWKLSYLSDSPKRAIEQICSVISEYKEIAFKEGSEISDVVGISFPGTLDRENSIIKYIPQFSNWKNVDLKTPIKSKTGFNIVIENDASAATLGEKWFGLGKNMQNFMLITLGTGVGGGIVSNNQLLTGKDNASGEIGHIIVEPEGRRCYCGNRGCLETYVSIEGLKQLYEERQTLNKPFVLEDFFRRVASGSSEEGQIFDRYLEKLSRGLAVSVNLINPDALVLGGKLSSLLEPNISKLKEYTNNKVIPPLKNSFTLNVSPLKSNAYVLGAAALAFELNQITISSYEKQKMRNNIIELREMVNKKTVELRKKEKELIESNKKLSEVKEKLNLALWASDKGLWEWNITIGKVFTDKRWLKDNNIAIDGFDGSFCSWCDLIHKDDFKSFISNLRKAGSTAGASFEIQYRLITKDDQWVWVLHQGKNIIRSQKGNPVDQHLIGTINNFSKQKEETDKLAYRANFDPLTGLPNRTLLIDRLIQETRRSERNEDSFALFFIDLDNFKSINDTYGHDMGDQLLKRIAQRFEKNRRKSDTFARIGGDEFILMALNVANDSDLRTLTKKYMSLFNQPLTINHNKIKIKASIGVAVFPENGSDSKTLIKMADKAMYQAKKNGKNSCCFYRKNSSFTPL
jgi:diguanylate cyclase (GGDEF)-like protein